MNICLKKYIQVEIAVQPENAADNLFVASFEVYDSSVQF